MSTVQTEHDLYAVARWGDGFFDINADGNACVLPHGAAGAAYDLREVAQQIVDAGLTLPVLVRFNDILQQRVRQLFDAFADVSAKAGYEGAYTAIYPIKVNLQRSVVETILDSPCRPGLEAGSKSELIAVLGMSRSGGTIICNGHKDREYVRLALIGEKLGLRVFIVLESLSELTTIMQEADLIGVTPRLGVRVKLGVSAGGNWQNSGGESAKFGLTTSQLLSLVSRLEDCNRLDCLQLLHSHIGSQIPNLDDIGKGLTELCRYFIELRKLGAPLQVIDVGGGLGIDYEGSASHHYCSAAYGLPQYAEKIITTIKAACERAGVSHPELMSESGRALTAHHAVLLTQVSDHEPAPGRHVSIQAEDRQTAALKDVVTLLENPGTSSPDALFAAAQSFRGNLRTLFANGSISIEDRARAEQLYAALCRKISEEAVVQGSLSADAMRQLNTLLAEKWFCNFSLFQSLPDVWAIDQIFPIMPLQRLNEPPTRRAILHDLTCDSDGTIDNYVTSTGIEPSLPVHALADGENYLLAIFLVGAYQEILGDIHNLFGDTDAVNIEVSDGKLQLSQPEHGDTTGELLDYVHFDRALLLDNFSALLAQGSLDKKQQINYLAAYENGLSGYTYLEYE